MPAQIVAVFCDGGVVGANPSTIAGTWAWCAVDDTDFQVSFGSGFIPAKDVPGSSISNNQTEWYAAMRALAGMAPAWSGELVSDSQITLNRLAHLYQHRNHQPSFLTVPVNLDWRWYRAVYDSFRTLGSVTFRHVKGHPTRVDLGRGHTLDDAGERKYDVSRHQVWCDIECTRQATLARRLLKPWVASQSQKENL